MLLEYVCYDVPDTGQGFGNVKVSPNLSGPSPSGGHGEGTGDKQTLIKQTLT